MKIFEFDTIIRILIIILVICTLTLAMLMIDKITGKCIQKENLCYKTALICGKGCVFINKPISCSDPKVKGSKEFCINRTSFIFGYKTIEIK